MKGVGRMSKSWGRIRTYMAFFLAIFILFFSSGCGMSLSLEPDKLMQPPIISTEQQKIESVLNKELPGGYTYKYPKSGTIQDAIVLKDFDEDDLREALVFVKENGDSSQAHVLILKETENHDWILLQDIEGSGAEIDQILLTNLEANEYNVVIGYSAYSNTKKMDIYRWTASGLDKVVSDISYLYFSDIPSPTENYQDLIVVSKEYDEGSTIEQARLSVYTSSSGDQIIRSSYVPLGVDIPQITESYTEYLKDSNETLIYLDLTITPGQDMFTLAYLYDSNILTPVLTPDGQEIRRLTVRAQTSVQDIDGDEHYEVKTQQDGSKLAILDGTKAEEYLEPAYWGSVENGTFLIKTPTIYNNANNARYLYLIPEEWAGLIKVSLSEDGEEMLIKGVEGDVNYLSILSISKKELSEERKADLKTSGYELILPEDDTTDVVYYQKIFFTDSTGSAGKILLYNALLDEAVKL